MNRYFYYTLRLVLFPMIICLGVCTTGIAQPTTFTTNLSDGGVVKNYILSDKGVFRQLVIEATVTNTSSSWFFPKSSGNMTEVWRPDGPGQMLPSLNKVIDPNDSSASARYHTDGGGFPGVLPEIEAGKFYTINISEETSGSNQYMAIMVTDTLPVSIDFVSQPEFPNAGIAQYINITTDTIPSPQEIFYIRYSTDGFTTSDTSRVTMTEENGQGLIPGFEAGTDVTYYVFSTTDTLDFSVLNEMWFNMSTLNKNNNDGLFYSYTTEAALPVILSNLSSRQIKRHIEVNWSTSVEVNNDYYTVERYESGQWKEIGSVNAQYGRSNDNYNYQFIDENPLPGFNIYQLSQTDIDGSHQILGDTKSYYAGIDIQIFPNPAADIVYIAGHNLPDDANLILKDIVGRDLVSIRNNRRLNSMDISKFPMGVYQLIVADRDQNILTVQRVIKQ
ncbi:MAG: T9SS type A sorting domain-containing protein [Saprospiraceae bacterium]|nr:T9SS type A sorting domain-containing protein [Saprospiraceae bacterium]